MVKLKNLNNNGSALGWTLMLILVFSIIGFAALTTSSSVFTRSITKNQENQAYITARSAIDTVTIALNKDMEFRTTVQAAITANTPLTVDDIDFGDVMGDCSIVITKENDEQIKLSATATVGTVQKKVAGIINKGFIEGNFFPADPVEGHLVDPTGQILPVGVSGSTAGEESVWECMYDNKYNKDANIKVRGNGDAFIYIRSGTTIKVNEIIKDDGTIGNLFIIIEEKAKLILNQNNKELNMDVYIYGMPNSALEIGKNVTINGDVKVDSFVPDNSFVLNKVKPRNLRYDFKNITYTDNLVYGISKYVNE